MNEFKPGTVEPRPTPKVAEIIWDDQNITPTGVVHPIPKDQP